MATRFNYPACSGRKRFPARLLHRMPPYAALMLLALITGLLTGTGAYILKHTVKWISEPIAGHLQPWHANWALLAAPLIGILLTGIYQRYILHKEIYHGTERLNRAIAERRYRLAGDLTYAPIVANTLTLGFGGSAGSEGPIAYTGAAIGSNIARMFGADNSMMRIMLACGASAGIAGIFKAPIGGVLFSLEVLSVSLTAGAVMALFVASVTAALTAYMLSSFTPDLVFNSVQPLSWSWMPWVILLGVFCGIYSFYYASIMTRLRQWYASMPDPWARNLISGLILSGLVFLFPALYGEGYSFMSHLLGGDTDAIITYSLFSSEASQPSAPLLMALGIIAVKAFACASTNSGGGVAGDFAPTLMAGCVAGFFLATLLNLLGCRLPVSDFAFFGMAAVMAGAVRAPFMAIFITVEMTQAYSMLLPVTVAAAVSYLIVLVLRYLLRLPSTLPDTF